MIDNELNLSVFDEFYHNDIAGPEAYPPQTLLKAVLCFHQRQSHEESLRAGAGHLLTA